MPSGIPGSTTYVTINCMYCGNEFTYATYWKPRKYCSRACSNKANIRCGEQNGRWNGGIYTSTDGRKRVFVGKQPNGQNAYEAEYRLIAEKKIGRKLTSSDIVHHIDNNAQNNNPENLKVTTRSDHVRIHRTQPKTIKYCKYCTAEMKLTGKEVKRNKKYCSKSCANKARSHGKVVM
jgi:hypothetical protein